jgi:predicted ATPase
MRVDRLFLKNFKNLQDFEVDFDVTSSRQVIVGRNAVGKSNLLEALAWIFRELDLEEEPSFEYQIEYHCNNHYVKIEAAKRAQADGFARSYFLSKGTSKPAETTANRDYKSIRQTDFYRRNRPVDGAVNSARVLPLYVFGYYSGVSGRFNRVFERHEEKYYREQITGEEAPLRSLFLAKPYHSQFALLSFFAASDEPAKDFLRNEFRISGLQSVLFALHEPYWKRAKRPNRLSPENDDSRFWRAGGKVSAFLDALYSNALAPMAGSSRRRVSVGQERTFEMRYCFIPDETALKRLAGDLEPKEFFARLESTIFSDLVAIDGSDVRIRVNLIDREASVTFTELSEGEQQLLTIIGLMRFTAQNESLFLLDEPDTHLNPAWCLDYLANLRDYGVEPPESQILMTTHSPLTFAGLNENEVVILQRTADGTIGSQHPMSAPRGMGFQAILTSEFFGLRSAIDRATLAKIDAKRELALKEQKSEDELRTLAALDEELGRLDFSKAARDPLYLEFIRAMTNAQKEYPQIAKPVPDTSDWHLRNEIAKDVAIRLLEAQSNDETH